LGGRAAGHGRARCSRLRADRSAGTWGWRLARRRWPRRRCRGIDRVRLRRANGAAADGPAAVVPVARVHGGQRADAAAVRRARRRLFLRSARLDPGPALFGDRGGRRTAAARATARRAVALVWRTCRTPWRAT